MRISYKPMLAWTGLMIGSLGGSAGAVDSTQWTPPSLVNQMSSASPETCTGAAATSVTVCGPYTGSATIAAQSHAQSVNLWATVGMTSSGSSATGLCAPWGGTVTAITLQAALSSGAVLSTQSGASEPPSYKTYVVWPMALPFIVPAGQGATITLSGGSNGKGCGSFTYTLYST